MYTQIHRVGQKINLRYIHFLFLIVTSFMIGSGLTVLFHTVPATLQAFAMSMDKHLCLLSTQPVRPRVDLQIRGREGLSSLFGTNRSHSAGCDVPWYNHNRWRFFSYEVTCHANLFANQRSYFAFETPK
jgi:hypothetical protein